LGDQEYGIKSLILKGKGLYLHASQLDFTHPITKDKLSITSNLPKKFKMIS
jgi:23S rRNA pseudouridine1911/1915/1917 synthase